MRRPRRLARLVLVAAFAATFFAGLAFDHVGPGAPYWSGALWVVAGLAAASLSFRPADRATHAT